jgi:hypothetical protein
MAIERRYESRNRKLNNSCTSSDITNQICNNNTDNSKHTKLELFQQYDETTDHISAYLKTGKEVFNYTLPHATKGGQN